MGRSHVASGLLVGVAAAPLAGLHDLPQVGVFAGLVGACSLIPDLDHQGSTVTRSLGPVGWVACRVLRACSRVLYAVTKGPRDEPGKGEHRHASHCAVFAAVFGALVAVVCGAVSGGGQLPISAAAIGAAAALGCLTHDCGDALTIAGCPILWPLPIAGETWYELRLLGPFSFRAGAAVETRLLRPAFLLAAVLLIPGVVAELVSAWHQVHAGTPAGTTGTVR